MSLYERFRTIVDQAGTPQNEATTRLWVIDPVLKDVLGYGVTELLPEEAGAAGSKPDYTILPDTPNTWFLEAKAWGIALSDQHAVQATTYAYHSGQRWVVVCNGRTWRLYDSHLISANVADKLVMEASQDAPDAMEAMLVALTRANGIAGGRDNAARHALLRQGLTTQLSDPESDVVKAVWTVARRLPGLASATRSEVVEAMLGPKTVRSLVVAKPQPEPGPTPPPTDTDPSTQPGSLIAISDPLLRPTGATPGGVRLPDGSVLPVRSWKQAFVECVGWLANNAPRPVPIPWSTGSRSRRRLWTNAEPQMADGQNMRAPVQIVARGRVVHLETHASAEYLVSLLLRLCAEVGVDPSHVRVTLR